MGKRVNSPLLRYLGWATFGVMTAAAVGMILYISNSLRTDRPPFSGCVANKGLTRSYWPMGRCWKGNARRKSVGTPSNRFCRIYGR
jgi:hypothetical protein